MKSTVFTLILCLISHYISSQNIVNVANLNIKLSFDETQDYYYSFDEGDEIVFNFQMKKGRHFKYVEIASPTNVVSTEFKAKKITNQRIKVLSKGVYRFRFYSSSLTNRVANVNIQRALSSTGNINFNTGWRWETEIDTNYVPYVKDSLIGYKITPYEETIKELVETKKEEILLFQKSQRVHSFYNANKSKVYLRVNLPKVENTPLKKEKILAWAYWIGVGEEGKLAYDDNVEKFTNFIGKTADQYFQTPLAGFALGTIKELLLPNLGDDVQYYFIPDYENVQLFYNDSPFLQFDMGKGKGAYGRNEHKTHGTFYIGLSNDNLTRGIDVEVKVIAVKESRFYQFKTYKKQRNEPQYIQLNKTRMQVSQKKYRVPVE